AAWLDAPMDVNGFHYAPGSLLVPAGKNVLPALQNVARLLALRMDGVRGKLPASHALTRARVAVYKPWGDNSDEGWTRWILEQYEFPFVDVAPADVRAGNLRSRFDAIVLPSASPEFLTRGLAVDEAPAPYAGGLGDDGLREIDA